MKHLFFLLAISLPLILIGCSNDEQESMPLSPDVSEPILQFEKTSTSLTQPYPLYQTFPEMNGVVVNWYHNGKGLVITINSSVKIQGQNQLFAVIEYGDVDPAREDINMVYLGSASKKTYLVRGLKNRTVSSIRVYLYNNQEMLDKPDPYPESQLFNFIEMKGWASGSDIIKVNSMKFPGKLKHIFAQLISNERNMLVFLARPVSEDFEFPNSVKLNVSDIRLFGYTSDKTKYYPYPIISQQ